MSPLVTAVIVSHDGEPWIPELLRGLEGQRRLPDRLIAVDTGSRDESVKLLEEVLGPEAVVSAPRSLGFGAAIQYGLGRAEVSQPAGRRSADSEPGPDNEWIWLLHDDCAPQPDALAALLDTAAERPGVAVIGCKVRGWPHGRHLLSVGVTISGTGRRETGLESRELDQGQHDDRRDVLAVDSCGMLIRRDVWDGLHGFDPNLALFRDDVDFGWRELPAEAFAWWSHRRPWCFMRKPLSGDYAVSTARRPTRPLPTDARRSTRSWSTAGGGQSP